MSQFYDTYYTSHLSPKPSTSTSTSKLQEYKQRYKNESRSININEPLRASFHSPEPYLTTPSSLKLSSDKLLASDSRSSLNALKALQGKIKTLENIIEMKDKEKEIIIRNYQDLTEKIRGDLEIIRNVERELRTNLRNTEQESSVLRGQLERELDIMTEKYQQKDQEVQVLKQRLDEKSSFIQENLAEYKQENTNLKQNNDRLNLINQNLSQELDELHIRLKELEEINKNLSQRSQEFQKESFAIKSSYDEAIEKYKQEFHNYQEMNLEKLGVSEGRTEELADEKRILENELKEARMNNELLQKELDSKEIENMRLKQRENKDKNRGVLNTFESRNTGKSTILSLKEEIAIDKQELDKNKGNNYIEFSETYLKKFTSPKRNSGEKTTLNNNCTYNKTLKSIKELDKEITEMNQEYQDLLMQSQNAKLSKDKEGVRQKIFYLSEMLRDATSKMYTLKKDEDSVKISGK